MTDWPPAWVTWAHDKPAPDVFGVASLVSYAGSEPGVFLRCPGPKCGRDIFLPDYLDGVVKCVGCGYRQTADILRRYAAQLSGRRNGR